MSPHPPRLPARSLLTVFPLRAGFAALLVAALGVCGCANAIKASRPDADRAIEQAAADDSIPSAAEAGLAESDAQSQ